MEIPAGYLVSYVTAIFAYNPAWVAEWSNTQVQIQVVLVKRL